MLRAPDLIHLYGLSPTIKFTLPVGISLRNFVVVHKASRTLEHDPAYK
jgi:hypothetical protein